MANLLFISLMNSAAWGGSEEIWLQTAKYALHHNNKVTCLVYDWEEKKKKLNVLLSIGATVIYIPNKGRKKKHFFEKLYYEWITKLRQYFFITQFSFNKYDTVVVNQGGFTDVTSGAWKYVYKKLPHYVLTFHNYDTHYSFKEKKRINLISWIEKAHTSFFASQTMIGVLQHQLNKTFNNAQVFLNPLTIATATTITPYPTLENNNWVMVMLAQLDVNRKAQDNLITALSNNYWHNKNFIVKLYGSGKDKSFLQALISQHGLDEKVILMGHTNNVEEVLNNAHLVLQITHKDAMPISVVEAMSKSRPVIVSNVGDMPLWIQNNETGWVAKDASVDNIEKILEIAWSNKDKWEQMGKNAFEFFSNKFSTSAEKFFYNKIITK